MSLVLYDDNVSDPTALSCVLREMVQREKVRRTERHGLGGGEEERKERS